MYDKEDFFSPEQVDERLDLSLLQRNSGPRGPQSSAADPNLLLVDDLRFLYSPEGAENARSLQRVWERIGEQRAGKQASSPAPQEQPPLRLLKADRRATPAPRKRKRRSAPNNVLTALAAMLFLVIVVGSLFAIVHAMRQPQLGNNPGSSTATPQAGQWTPVAGYPYPTPGKTTSISPSSADGFSCLTFSLDGKQVAASTQGNVWIWGVNSNAQPFVYDPQAGSNPVVVAWSPAAPLLAVGTNPVQIIDSSGNVQQYHYPALAGASAGSSAVRVTALAWSPDGTKLAVAGYDPAVGNEVNIWDVNKGGNPLYTVPGQQTGDIITSLSWSSDGRYVAFANGQSVQAWDTHTPGGTPIFQHTLSGATDVAWSPGGSNAGDLAFASNGSTQVWNVWVGVAPVGTLVSNYPDTPNGSLSWSPNGHYLATASGHNVIIYNATTGVHLYTYGGNTHDVHALAWSPDGRSIASGERASTSSNYVRVWSA